jgi:membrane-associated phospholipid phosphatase
MFQTELNLFLQANGGPFWDQVWWSVSELGRTPTYLAVLVVVSFGIDLRRGWCLGVALVWTAAVTQYAKILFALPRPFAVDSRVLYPPTGARGQEHFTGRGAPGPFASLPADVVEYYRARAAVDWGLPSGHTSTFTAFTGGLSLLVWQRRWWIGAVAGAFVMGWSRIYLGRHFLADVLAGAALGFVAVAAFRLATVERPATPTGPSSVPWRGILLFAAPALLLPLVARRGDLYAAQLWAWNLGYWMLARRRRSYSGGRPGQRVARVLVAMAVGGIAWTALRTLAVVQPFLRGPWDALLVAFGSVLALLVGGVRVAERLGLYPQVELEDAA